MLYGYDHGSYKNDLRKPCFCEEARLTKMGGWNGKRQSDHVTDIDKNSTLISHRDHTLVGEVHVFIPQHYFEMI